MQAVVAALETPVTSGRYQHMNQGECFLLLGGAGLTGKQIARRISTYLNPRKIVIASLFEYEVNDTLEDLRQEYADKPIEWEGEIGNVFVRRDFVSVSRSDLLKRSANRDTLYDDLYGNIDTAYHHSEMVR